MLCFSPARSLGRRLPGSQGLGDSHILTLLRGLQRIPPHKCLRDRTHFDFPCKRGDATVQAMRKEEATCCYLQMLQQVFRLFSSRSHRAAGEQVALERLLAGLAERREELERTAAGTRPCPALGTAVRKYFQRLTSYLKGREYSPCAWEIVRGEIRSSLSRVNRPPRKDSQARRNWPSRDPLPPTASSSPHNTG